MKDENPWRKLPGILKLAAALLCLGAAVVKIPAATLWTGAIISYSQPAPDPTQATNQDRLTDHVWLTRAASKGLFNAYSETNATSLSPADTEWSFGQLTNYATLYYTNWLGWLNGASPVTLVGQPVVLHLISDDIYLSVQFTNWASGGAGGFAYLRSTPPTVNEAPIFLSSPQLVDGEWGFQYSTTAGLRYAVESSTNLVNWLPQATNTATGEFLNYTNLITGNGNQFFRVVQLPNN